MRETPSPFKIKLIAKKPISDLKNPAEFKLKIFERKLTPDKTTKKPVRLKKFQQRYTSMYNIENFIMPNKRTDS